MLVEVLLVVGSVSTCIDQLFAGLFSFILGSISILLGLFDILASWPLAIILSALNLFSEPPL